MMIATKFDRLRREKAAREDRNLPLRTIATETGIALSTLHHFGSGKLQGVRLTTLDTLCRYFGVATIAELIEYHPEAPAGGQAAP